MGILVSILFLLAGIGVINGFIAGIILIFRRETPTNQRYLGTLLIMLSIRIGKSVFYYFDHSADRLVLQIGLSACVFIGPLFYKYVSTKIQNQSTFSNWDLFGFSFLLAGILTVGIIFPYRSYPEIWNGYIVRYIYLVWVIFTIIGVYLTIIHIKNNHNMNNYRFVARDQLFIVTIAVAFITLTYQCALYISGFTYIWGALAFTFFFYYIMATIIFQQQAISKKGKTSAIIKNGQELLLQVNVAMERNQLFLNPRLKLDDLADEGRIDRNTLSRVLNEVYPNGFSYYVNEFRVKEAQRLILERPELSLEGIGYEAGFNSKSSFFAAFKRISGQTPSQYKKSC